MDAPNTLAAAIVFFDNPDNTQAYYASKPSSMASRVRTVRPRNKDKTIVLVMVERGGKGRTHVVDTRRKRTLQSHIRENVQTGSAVFSVELKSYSGLAADFQHAVINHALEYANGNVYTNTMENCWSLVKRQLHGTYISVQPYHLFRYREEQSFLHNSRKLTDAERFAFLLSHAAGYRLTLNRLTGKDKEEDTATSV